MRDQQQGGVLGSGQHCSAVTPTAVTALLLIPVVCSHEQAALDSKCPNKHRLVHLASMIANGWRMCRY